MRSSPSLFAALALLALSTCCRAAQNLQTEFGKLTPSCQKLLKSYATSTSPIGACTGVGDLAVSLFGQSDSGGAGTSILPVLSGWMSTTCAQPVCSAATIKKANADIAAACGDDLDKKSYLPLVTQAVLKNYSLARKILCSHSDKSKRYCADEVLTGMEKAVNTKITAGYFSAMITQPSAFLNELKGTAWCTKCLNNAVSEAKPIIQDVNPSAVKDVNDILEDKCKADFTPGAKPSGISEATGKDALDFTGQAMSRARISVGALVIVALVMLLA